jgi:multidrug efflux pump
MVSDSVEDRTASVFTTTRRAVLLMISRQPDANIIATIDAINRQMPELRALLPADADLAVVMDRSPAIRATLRESQQALLIAAGLVMLVVLSFPGQRARRADHQRGHPRVADRRVRPHVSATGFR